MVIVLVKSEIVNGCLEPCVWFQRTYKLLTMKVLRANKSTDERSFHTVRGDFRDSQGWSFTKTTSTSSALLEFEEFLISRGYVAKLLRIQFHIWLTFL